MPCKQTNYFFKELVFLPYVIRISQRYPKSFFRYMAQLEIIIKKINPPPPKKNGTLGGCVTSYGYEVYGSSLVCSPPISHSYFLQISSPPIFANYFSRLFFPRIASTFFLPISPPTIPPIFLFYFSSFSLHIFLRIFESSFL